ncbi:MAG: hypothetical protein C0600_03690 [Ignavibacteria bacterium]|nr:MAG: hypothetical protein C0600_03690 [Ignavibacteria bacterium]
MALPRFEKEWDGFRGHVAVKWENISEDELLKVEGNFGELVSLIVDKYGEQKASVEAKVKEMYEGYLETKEKISQGISDVKEDIGHRSKDLADNIKEKAGEFQQTAKETISRIREENIDPAVQKSEEYIKVHPFTAVLGAFGVGMLLGGVIAAMARSKD